jgi:PAS domain S-box-containing protein
MCEKKMGFTKEELYSPDFDIDILAVPEHLEIFQRNLHLSSIGEVVKPFELLMTDRGGKVLYTMVNTQPIQIGEEQAILGVIVDISEQRWAEDIVKQKANQIDNFFKIMVDRELKLVDLKKEVNYLLEKSGENAKYDLYNKESTQSGNGE